MDAAAAKDANVTALGGHYAYLTAIRSGDLRLLQNVPETFVQEVTGEEMPLRQLAANTMEGIYGDTLRLGFEMGLAEVCLVKPPGLHIAPQPLTSPAQIKLWHKTNHYM